MKTSTALSVTVIAVASATVAWYASAARYGGSVGPLAMASESCRFGISPDFPARPIEEDATGARSDLEPVAPFLEKGIAWLVQAQHPGGGWGAGAHAKRKIRDPQAFVTDPATTALVGLALIRAGHTPAAGKYRDTTRKAVAHLVRLIEEFPAEGPRITSLTGTQPQRKLGPEVDTPLAVQFLSRVVAELPGADELKPRVDAALAKCITKLQNSQHKDGSWGNHGWASVLHSSFGCNALELASAVGASVDKSKLDNAQLYQEKNFSGSSGRADARDSAGVELYAFSASQRAGAGKTRAAERLLKEAKRKGDVRADAPVSKSTLTAAGLNEKTSELLARAHSNTEAQLARLDDETLLKGFGSNGGEEFLSYMLTSESLVITGGELWKKWNAKMHTRLANIQNPDGSWTGHHCITSPVFCTAAVAMCLTANRDAALLEKVSEREIASATR